MKIRVELRVTCHFHSGAELTRLQPTAKCHWSFPKPAKPRRKQPTRQAEYSFCVSISFPGRTFSLTVCYEGKTSLPEESICNFKLMQSGNDATGTADMKQFYRDWKIKAAASLCVQIIQQISHLLPKLATESWQSSWQWAVYREYLHNDTTLQPKKKMCCYLRRLKEEQVAHYLPAAWDRLQMRSLFF